jgi:5-methylcytosine-specific restriction endonuclease McrA
MGMDNYKICTKCGEEFPATTEFFCKMKTGEFGLQAECKVCHRKYYKDNKEKYAATNKKWRKNNKGKCTTDRKEWYENNREWVVEYRKDNKEKIAVNTVLTEVQQHQIDLIYKIRDELGSNYHVDHIIPVSKGGQTHPDNLQIVLKSYNLQKHNKLNFRPPTDKEIFNWN